MKRLLFAYRMKWQQQTTERVPKRKCLVMGTFWYKKIQARWKRKSSQIWE